MSELIKDLKLERVQGSEAILQYSNFDYWVNWEDVEEIVKEHEKQPQLNDNQQIVLDWLKSNVEQDNASPMLSITLLGTLWESRKFNIKEDIKIDDAYCELDYKQQAQVLEVFAKWAQEEEVRE